MNNRIIRGALLGVALGIAILVTLAAFAPPTYCKGANCIGQFCGRSSECPGDCHCAKLPWEITGQCL